MLMLPKRIVLENEISGRGWLIQTKTLAWLISFSQWSVFLLSPCTNVPCTNKPGQQTPEGADQSLFLKVPRKEWSLQDKKLI